MRYIYSPKKVGKYYLETVVEVTTLSEVGEHNCIPHIDGGII